MIDTSSLDKVGEYIEQLEEGGKQARKRVIELVDENKKLKEWNSELIENHKKDIALLCEENKKLKEAMKALIDNYSHVLWNDVELKGKNITKIMINGKEYDLGCKIEF